MKEKIIIKFIFISALVFLSFIVTNAQNSDKFTYRDLLNQQKIERQELKETQNETLDKILARQKDELETVKGNTGPTQTMQTQHQSEREKIVQLQKEEREKQMQIQADDRKNFKPL